MKKQNIIIVFATLHCLVTILIACKNSDPKKEAEGIIREWMGKTILFPDSISCLEKNKNVSCPDYTDYPYKILLYADSTGCTNCKLHLREWGDFIEEVDTIFTGQVAFLFYFQPKNKEDLISTLRIYNFKHPVYLDSANSIHQLNNFPSDEKYQCFLLDRNNQVVMIGNPLKNPVIWDLFKEYINGEPLNKEKEVITTINIDSIGLNFGVMHLNEEKEIQIPITNTGQQPLIIKRVSTSCGCTVADWEKHPIAPGNTTILKLRLTPEETGVFHKRIDIVCNIQEQIVKLTIEGKII